MVLTCAPTNAVIYLNNLKRGECVHFKKVFYVSEAAGLEHRFMLDWPRFQWDQKANVNEERSEERRDWIEC